MKKNNEIKEIIDYVDDLIYRVHYLISIDEYVEYVEDLNKLKSKVIRLIKFRKNILSN